MALLGVAAALAASACNPSTQNTSGADNSSSTPGSTSSDGSHTEQTTYQITQTVSQLQLDAHSGRVTVTAGNGPISVTESYTYSDDKPATSHAVNGDTLDLKEDGCQHERTINGRCEVGWDIQVPAGTTLALTTRAGGIAVTGMAGQIDAKTNAGGVRARSLASKTVTAKTNAGGVDLQFAQVPDQVQATSNAGGIEVVVPAGQSYAVQADSNTGRPEVDVNQSDSSTHKIQAKTNAGSIEISNG
jgi:DUF4097 and DUF4098 domain-containing protein YvlB